jgi:hypothetical protein
VSALRRGTVPSSGLDALAVGHRYVRADPRRGAESVAAPAAAASRPYVASTAPARPSSAAGCRSGRAPAASRPLKCRSTRPRRRCTGWRRSIAGWSNTWAPPTRRAALSRRDRWLVLRAGAGRAGRCVGGRQRRGGAAAAHRRADGGRLGAISKTAPAFSAVLRTYRRALAAGDGMLADGLISWLAGQPNVAAASSVRRASRVTWITSAPPTFSSAC